MECLLALIVSPKFQKQSMIKIFHGKAPNFVFGREQDFLLAKQVLYCLSHTSSSFCSGYFGYFGFRKLFAQVGLEL
jgi:hypothetical protein